MSSNQVNGSIRVLVMVLVIIGMSALAVTLLSSAKASTITVGQSGGENYASIQDAINATSSGDTVYVYGGIYNEEITISKSIFLTGESEITTIIEGTIIIQANNVNISKFTVRNSEIGIEVLNSINVTIRNFIISNNSNYGIYLVGTTDSIITDSTITNSSKYGIYLFQSSNNNISSNIITNSSNGIYLLSNNNIIIGNAISNNQIGIYVSHDGYETGGGFFGLIPKEYVYTQGLSNTISSNNIFGNIQYGLYKDSSSTGNTAKNNWWGSATGPKHSTNTAGTGDNVSGDISISPWVLVPFIVNTPPTAYITTPTNTQIFVCGDSIDFTGYGIDAEDDILTNTSITWSSSVSGNIGVGNITLNNLSAGTHKIRLTVKDSKGSTGSSIVNITVLPKTPPLVNVTFSGLISDSAMVAETHIGFNANVSAYSESGITLYEWDANGDGVYEYTSATTGDIKTNLTTPGNTTISVRVTAGNGTQTVKSFEFTVVPNLGPQLNAKFTNPYNSAISESNFTITEKRSFTINISAIDKDGVGSICIDPYSDGSGALTSTNKEYYNISWQYASPGNYTLKATAVDGVGAESNKTYNIRVIPNVPPNLNFTIPASWSSNSPLQLLANASDSDGNVVSYAWNFGDGSISYEQNPTHAWTSKDAFVINLTATDDLGGVNSIERTLSITNAAPSVTLAANTTRAQTYTSITFYEPSDPVDTDGSVISHSYDFGDGNTTNITGSSKTSIKHTYTSKGTYNVTLKVYDNDGGFAVKNLIVNIINTPPALSILSSITSPTLTSIKFNANASDIDGDIVSYTWNFGDVNSISDTAYTSTAFYTYSVPGEYTVAITVKDNDGGTMARTIHVTITNRLPTCSFTASTNKKAGEEITFTTAANDSDGTVSKYKWDFGDGDTTEWLDSSTIRHTYLRAGRYNASLTVKDNNGGESTTYNNTITITNIPPVAVILRPKYVYVDEETQFLGNGSYDTYGSVVSYLWNFDDGTTSTEINPKHTYKKAGSYKVSLKVTDDSGGAVTQNETIEVVAQVQLTSTSEQKDIMDYLDLYANLIGLLIAGLSVVGGFFLVRRKKGVLSRQISLVEDAMKVQNPIERYRILCDIQKASSTLLKLGKISENNYMILDSKIRDYRNTLERKHPKIHKVADLQRSPYLQHPKDNIGYDSYGEYNNR